jgi:hypothetical protein
MPTFYLNMADYHPGHQAWIRYIKNE